MNFIEQELKNIFSLKERQDFKTAKNILEKCLCSYNDDYRLYEEMADVYLHEGDLKKAQIAVNYAKKLQPYSSTGLYLQGYIELCNNNYLEAIWFLEQSNIMNPNNPEVLRNLGWAHVMNKDIKKGIFILQRALNLYPEDELIIEDIWMAYLSDGNTEQAEFYLDKIGKNVYQKSIPYS